MWRKRPNPQTIYACGGDKLGAGGRCLYLSYIFTCSNLRLSKSKSAFGWPNFFLFLGRCTFHQNLFVCLFFFKIFYLFIYFKLWKTFCCELWSSWSFLHDDPIESNSSGMNFHNYFLNFCIIDSTTWLHMYCFLKSNIFSFKSNIFCNDDGPMIITPLYRISY